jgi:hypothetical protein
MDLNNLSDSELKRIAKTCGFSIKNYSKNDVIKNIQNNMIPNDRKSLRELKKLIHQYQKYLPSIIQIQRWWRKINCPLTYVNDSDFISMEPITTKIYCLIEETGHAYQFNPLVLANYFLKEGNFVNPYTRKPLNEIELRRLDKMVKEYVPNFVSLHEEYKRIAKQRLDDREHLRVCQLLHQDCLEVVDRVFRLINTEHFNKMRVEYRLNRIVLPDYFSHFRQLYLLDQSMACESALIVLANLYEFLDDPSVTNTLEKYHTLQTLVSQLELFIKKILPMLPFLLPDILRQNNQQQVR